MKEFLAIPIMIIIALPIWICLIITSAVHLIWFYTVGLTINLLVGEVSFEEFNYRQKKLIKGYFRNWII